MSAATPSGLMVTHRALVAVFLLLIGLAPAHAATATADDVEVAGPIQALSTSTLTVAGRTFTVTAQTRIRGAHGATLAFSALAIGMIADVEGHQATPTSLVADRIDIEDADDGGEVRVDGPVTARTDSSLTAGSLTFAVTPATRIDGAPSFASVALGTRVEIRGRLLTGGRLVADRIRVRDAQGGGDDGTEVHGLISAVSADSLTVSGRTFALTTETVIVGHHQTPLPASALAVGQRVEVHGRYLASGRLVATRIEIETFGEGEVEITGRIEALADSALTVAGTAFVVTARTVVLGRDRRPILFSTLALGQTVEIRSALDASGRRVATRIQLEDAGIGGEVEARAALDAVGDSLVVLLGRPFVVRPATRILSQSGQTIALSTLAAGQPVEIHARLETDGTLTALRIDREDGPATAVQLRAALTAVTADSVAVLGIPFATTGATVVRADGAPGTLADLAVGQTVELTGTRTAAGALTATRISIRRSGHAAGRIGTTGAGTFGLPGLAVTYSSATLFVTEAGAPVAASSLAAGTDVQASGTAAADGTLDARLVVVLRPAAPVVAMDVPAAGRIALERIAPNPTTGAATVRYTLETAARVEITLVDALGRTVLRLADTDADAGLHEARLDAAGLPAGLYLVRLTVDGRPAGTRPVTVVR